MPKNPLIFGKEFAEATSISIELVVPVVLGALFGYKIDEYLKTYPLFLIIGVLLGGISGLWSVYKIYIAGKK